MVRESASAVTEAGGLARSGWFVVTQTGESIAGWRIGDNAVLVSRCRWLAEVVDGATFRDAAYAFWPVSFEFSALAVFIGAEHVLFHSGYLVFPLFMHGMIG